jgi:acyl carrier protein
MTGIKSEVRAYITDNFLMGTDARGLGEDTSFLDIGILDSTGVIELIAFLEERYGIHVEDEEMVPENLDTLNAIEHFVTAKLSVVGDPIMTACS